MRRRCGAQRRGENGEPASQSRMYPKTDMHAHRYTAEFLIF